MNTKSYSLLLFQSPENRVKQIKQILAFFAILGFVVSLNELIFRQIAFAGLLVAGVVFLAFLFFYITCDTANVVSGMLIWTATILASLFAWNGAGLYDSAIYIYPSILIFSAYLGGREMLVPLYAFMATTLLFFSYAHVHDLIPVRLNIDTSIYMKAVNLLLILSLFGGGIFVVSQFVQRLISRLQKEQAKSERMQKAANRLLSYDHLTQLPNEISGRREFVRLFDKAKDSQSILGFITLKLHEISRINASLGHEIGDKALLSMSRILTTLAENRGIVFRSSGKEFVLLILAVDYEDISEFSYQLQQACTRPILINDLSIEIDCSIGIAVAPNDGEDFDLLRKRAHAALSKTDTSDTQSIQFFEPKMEQFVIHRLKIAHELREAINRHEFELFYQPKIELRTNRIVGAEALIRWHKNFEQFIPPNQFIPFAEESGLIHEMGNWALRKACVDCKIWHQLGFKGLSVAVNLSPVQFKRGSLPNNVFRALHIAELAPRFLELEVTESLAIDNKEQIEEQLSQMVKRGVHIAIDDFGTGYSNLNYLSRFHAKTLKIDMSFIKELRQSEHQKRLVEAIIKMSHVIDLVNVAEGVEDKETLTILESMGCLYGQGYYWSKPLANSDFIAFLKQSDHSTVRDTPNAD